jgi:hypothetical protein
VGPRTGLPTRELLGRYVRERDTFWAGNPGHEHQCAKLCRHLDEIEEHFGLDCEEALDQVVTFGLSRVTDRPATVYVTGRGGSGSHWLAEMLGDLGPFADAGEVTMPAPLSRELVPWPVQEQSLFIDCLHVLHAWPGRPYADQPGRPHEDIARLHVVNSNGDSKPVRAKLTEPGCVFVHLIRDPRDQVMSYAYRKPGPRERYPVAASEDFVRLMLIFNRLSLVKILGGPVGPDLIVRYEDLRAGAAPALREIAARAGEELDDSAFEDVAFRHSAEARRRGMAPMGNLSAQPSTGWRQLASPSEKLLMHSGLAEVVDTLGYQPDDCRGGPLEFSPVASAHEVTLPDGVVLGEIHVRSDPDGDWERAGHAAGTFTIPAGKMVRLRVPGGWTTGGERLVELLPAGCLSSLCLAGNAEVTDEFVSKLAGWTELIELDLARTPVTDACVEWVAQIGRLAHVSVAGTGVSAAGQERLRTALPGCKVSAVRLIPETMRGLGYFDEELVTEPPV